MSTEDRLTDLETRYAHQELALEELTKVSHEQYLKIEDLIRQLKQLTRHLEGAGAPTVADQKPPHY